MLRRSSNYKRFARRAVWLVLLVASAAARAEAPAEPPAATPEGIEFFEKHIRPLFAEKCLECHGDKRQGGLELSSRAGMLAGSDSGPTIAPGNPDGSLLVQAVRYVDEPKMPPEGKLADEQIASLETWIKMGAPWPDDGKSAATRADHTTAASSHWAFQPIARPALPAVVRSDWPTSPIDHFILARLEQQGLAPSPQADRRTVYRRASFDVTGLPPMGADVARLEADADPRALDRALESLLASPHYGERWARHWLDIARYADSKGYVFTDDRNYPNAYKYRDWVVRALNEDLPYDDFLIEQIAADRLIAEGRSASLEAMGFLTVGRRFLNNPHDIIDDRLDVLTRGTMGLTVTCARCHDHKYDPIPTADYYSLYGVLASSNEPKEPADVMTLADNDQPNAPYVFLRGNPGNRGPDVPRQFLSIVAGADRQPFQQGSGRLELARAIADGDNPLTARVIVNRIWMYYFDNPLVGTPSDFGLRSDPPTHPELLDYLASTLVDSNWSLKTVQRLILDSATYRQASTDREDGRQIDPENRLVWRMNRKRLDFEAMRDGLLAASGQLDRSLGGPSVEITEAPWTARRSLYGRIDRQNLPNLFRTFDFASPDTHSPRRYTTTVPQQALYLMNSPFVNEQARKLAQREDVAALAEPRDKVMRLYDLALARKPSERELELGMAFLSAEQPLADAPAEQLSPLERYAQVLLLSNEFMFVD